MAASRLTQHERRDDWPLVRHANGEHACANCDMPIADGLCVEYVRSVRDQVLGVRAWSPGGDEFHNCAKAD